MRELRGVAGALLLALTAATCRPPEPQRSVQASATGAVDSAGYLFEWVRAFDAPLYVRLARTPAETVATWTRWRLDRSTPADSGRRRLSAAEWRRFEALLAAADFWQLPAEQRPSGAVTTGVDGADWTVRGMAGARRHVVTRWSPPPHEPLAPFYRLALYMAEVSGAPVDSGRVY